MLNTFLKGLVIMVLLSFAYFLYVGMTNKGGEMSTSVVISAPAEHVFTYLAEPDKTAEWITGLKKTELVSGEPLQPGSEYRVVFDENGKDIVMTEIITDFVPNRQLAFDLKNEFVNGHIDIQLEPSDEGTIVTEINRFSGNNFIARAMTGLFKQAQKKRQVDMYLKLKEVAEASYDQLPVINEDPI